MNGRMNGTEALERQISEGLHDHSRLAPEGDGWEAILGRIEQRGRARHRRRAVSTGLVLAGLVGSLVVLAGDDRTRVSTTPAPADAPPAPAASAGLPRLVFEVPGFSLVNVSLDEASDPGLPLDRILVYTAPGDGLLGSGPVLFARLVPPGTAYGIGDGPGVTEVDVGGATGRRIQMTVAATSLGWYRPDGSIVHLLALGIPEGDLLAAGTALEEALARGQEPSANLPGGVVLRRATGADASSSTQSEVTYGSGSRQVGLRLRTGGEYRLDALLLDRLASSAGRRPTTVGGKPAVLSIYEQLDQTVDQSVTLLWAFDDGVVAELTGHGLTEAELLAAAASIHEVDEAGWLDLLARVPPPADVHGPVGDDPLAEIADELCRDRNRWLTAHAAGDGPGEDAAVTDLRTVVAKGRAAGLGANSDILVVGERLLEAMAAGDEAAVSSIPEGGACS